MLRIFVLIGFTFIFMHLHATGDISKYINMKYGNISFITIFVLLFLTIAQMYFYLKSDKNKEEHHHHDHDACSCCDHDHEKEEDKWYKKLLIYPLLLFPIISVLFFPVATLNSKMVEAKGFHFPILEDNDPSSMHQILAPDTSSYYGAEDYTKMLDKLMKRYGNKDNVVLDDQNFLEGMEVIYNYPGSFMGNNVQFDGFTFNSKDIQNNQIFVFRFGIIHCVADSGVYGMLVEFPEKTTFHNDEWIHVNGKLSSMYYQPFKKTIPVLKVETWNYINKPSDEYVYRQY
ncbi:TIGR03943 family putative permease subunit [Bacillus songklensis]|uniref:TIGR03943 family putative permease subunit n=1 Tax=Bacillus songklensis TaxID=1069116 RepID=A0ABV8B7K2_9BACI